jgi:MoaA/NifB/PqqE/SkfB family radical SAM enzyme
MLKKITNRIKRIASYHTGRYLIAPDFLSLLITYHCNFQCQTCNIWNNKKYPDLDNNIWDKIADKIIKFFPPKTYIELNGGEPLIRKRLVLELTEKLKKNNFVVSLNTNGSLLDQPTVKELEKSGLDFIKLSLYSLNENIHDELRGYSGAAKLANKALQLLKGSRIKTEVGILITNSNLAFIKPLIEFLIKNYPQVSIILQPLDEVIESLECKNNRVNSYPQDLWPKTGDVEKLFNWLLKNKFRQVKNSKTNLKAIKKYYLDPRSALERNCLAGQHSLVIYPNGNISFCFKRKMIGNIVTNSFKDILYSRSINERKSIRHCRKYCRIIGCNYSRKLDEIISDKFK